MDQERFDHLARDLAAGITRRGMVRNLTGAAIGAVLAAAGASEVGARKKKRGKGKRKGRAQARADKVAVCHYDADADTFVLMTVDQRGWGNEHARHEKDFKRGGEAGCCLDGECSGLTDECNVGKCVVNDDDVGACQVVPTPGETCDDGGTCDGEGRCQPNTSGVCSGKVSANPCFEFDADTCGGIPGGKSCRCGADINGNLTCFENAYCLNPRVEAPCASNADCVARGFPQGSVCFSAENCCLGGPAATGCTTPCPTPSA
jgi:hypothetical protein